jgi:acyl-CoA thioesterase II
VPVFTLDDLLGVFRLDQVDTHRYRAESLRMGPVVFGGQLLGQSILAALRDHPGKAAKTLQTVFARSASPEAPLDIEVDSVHAGRTFASSTVTFSQAGRVCVRSTVLMNVEEPDLIRHADSPVRWSPPPVGAGSEQNFGPFAVRIVGDVDVNDAEAVGPPELDVWARCPAAPADPAINQALLAFLTEGFLIGAAMRPHEGVGQSQAHVTLTTGVLTQMLTFHEPVSAAGWLLLQQTSSYTGHGMNYGRGDVFNDAGTLVASYAQDSMIRRKASTASGAL